MFVSLCAGRSDDPEVWKLNHNLAIEGRECWRRDYVGEVELSGLQGVGTEEQHAKLGHDLWADQQQVFRQYGDSLAIAPVDVSRE